jgi:hypothetical protein
MMTTFGLLSAYAEPVAAIRIRSTAIAVRLIALIVSRLGRT